MKRREKGGREGRIIKKRGTRRCKKEERTTEKRGRERRKSE